MAGSTATPPYASIQNTGHHQLPQWPMPPACMEVTSFCPMTISPQHSAAPTLHVALLSSTIPPHATGFIAAIKPLQLLVILVAGARPIVGAAAVLLLLYCCSNLGVWIALALNSRRWGHFDHSL